MKDEKQNVYRRNNKERQQFNPAKLVAKKKSNRRMICKEGGSGKAKREWLL